MADILEVTDRVNERIYLKRLDVSGYGYVRGMNICFRNLKFFVDVVDISEIVPNE